MIEFHGTMSTASCMSCGKGYLTEELSSRMNSDSEDFYICKNCNTQHSKTSYIKPDVVLFGDRGKWFTEEGFQHIIKIVENADCVLVLGTSLLVTPFSIFPSYRKQGVPLIIINKGDTPYDNETNTVIIQESIGKVLGEIDANLE